MPRNQIDYVYYIIFLITRYILTKLLYNYYFIYEKSFIFVQSNEHFFHHRFVLYILIRNCADMLFLTSG